jgi:hypothetical protein
MIEQEKLYKLSEVAQNQWLGTNNVFTIRGMIQDGRLKAVNVSKNDKKYNLYKIKGSPSKILLNDDVLLLP